MIVWILVVSYVVSVVGYFIYLLFFPPIKKDKPSLLLSDYIDMKITYCDICEFNATQEIGEDPMCYNGPNCMYRGQDITTRCVYKGPKVDINDPRVRKHLFGDNTE